MLENAARNPFANSTQQFSITTSLSRTADAEALDGAVDGDANEVEALSWTPRIGTFLPKSFSEGNATVAGNGTRQDTQHDARSPRFPPHASHPYEYQQPEPVTRSAASSDPESLSEREDHITDTIGAIAVDRHGNIACAASSGGISMKHRGRVGPAALIGIGASVIPVDPNDPDQTSVAAVTSGTGEHMATTFAAHAAAQRIRHPRKPRNLRRSSTTHSIRSAHAHSEPVSPVSDDTEIESWPSSSSLRSSNASSTNLSTFEEPCNEGEAIQAFIASDFLAHPSVRHSQSAGAIGALVVRKTVDGVYLYFAHNTDSFALASMHCDDHRPVCTMSRKTNESIAAGNSGVAHGARAMRFRQRSSARNR
jgi:taspase (threonine aspartase 1)